MSRQHSGWTRMTASKTIQLRSGNQKEVVSVIYIRTGFKNQKQDAEVKYVEHSLTKGTKGSPVIELVKRIKTKTVLI